MQIDLANRVMLITGAYSGIGFACARACINAGAEVVIHARRAEELPRALERLGRKASGVAGDLKDGDAPQAMIAEVLRRHGRIDGLVNNAAMLTRCTLETLTHDLIQAMLAVNTIAPLLLIKAALPYL